MKARRTGRNHQSWLVPVWFALLFVAEFKFEGRSVLASAAGIASPRVVTEFATYCLAGTTAFVYLTRNAWHRSRSAGLDLFLAYGLLALASAMWSEIPLFSAVRGVQVVSLGLVAKATASIWSGRSRDLYRDWRSIWTLFVGFVSALGVFGFVAPNTWDGRFAWQGMHPVGVGGLLGLAVIASTVLLMQSSNKARSTRTFLLGAWIWCWWLLLLTVTRSALAATGVSLVALIGVYAYRGNSRGRALVMFLSTSAVGLLWWFSPVITAYVLRGQTTEQFATLTGRVQLWDYGMGLFSKAPITGYGFGSGRVLLTEAFPWGGTGHNLWVEIALGLGIPGMLLVTALIVWVLRLSVIMLRTRPTAVSVGAFGVGLLIAVKSLGAETFAVPGSEMTIIALITAAITAERNILSRTTPRIHREHRAYAGPA